MSFKIGFTAENENRNENIGEMPAVPAVCGEKVAKKSLVDVFFQERHLTCTYYNDMFDLKRGDIVYVDGKLEGMRGRVVDVSYCFKIKLSDYKRVIGVAQTSVKGKFFFGGSHFITADKAALSYEKAITWFKAPAPSEEEIVSANDEKSFNIEYIGDMNVGKEVFDRGHEYYLQNKVKYIELNGGKGRAIVTGSKPYEVEFTYRDGYISGLVCDCWCSGKCKHEVAVMLELSDILDLIEAEYPEIDPDGYFAAVERTSFFEFVVDNVEQGSLELNNEQ